SAADWGRSDPLLTLTTAKAMLAAGFSADDVDLVLWRNPVEFYAQSNNLMLDPVPGLLPGEPPAPGAEFARSAVLRGARKSDEVLLSSCTHVHPAEDLDGVIDQLLAYAVPVRAAAGLDVLGVGLWMPAALAHQLDADPAAR